VLLISKVGFWMVFITVLCSPIPFASNTPLAWNMVAATIALGSVLYWIALPKQSLPVLIWGAVLGYLVVLLWAGIQASTLTPLSWHHPLWQMLGLKGSIALDRGAVVERFTCLLSYLLAFVTLAQGAMVKNTARLILRGLLVMATLIACYGLYIFMMGNHEVLWIDKYAYLNDVTGTFINRNSFATFCGMALLLSIAVLPNRHAALPTYYPFKERLAYIMGHWFNERQVWWLLPPMVLMTTLLLTHSRGGLLAVMVGLWALCTLLMRKPVFMVIGVILGIVLIVGDGGTLARVKKTDIETEERFRVYTIMLEAIERAPWFGYGLGNFDRTFKMMQDERVHGYYDKAHSDVLEIIFDMGVLGASVFFISMATVIWVCIVGYKHRQQGKWYPALGIAVSVMVLVHSVVDFSMQMPAVALWYATMLGLAVGQSRGKHA
jgi:O-antigen ligase